MYSVTTFKKIGASHISNNDREESYKTERRPDTQKEYMPRNNGTQSCN